MRKKNIHFPVIIFILSWFLLFACNRQVKQQPIKKQRKAPVTRTYNLVNTKQWLAQNPVDSVKKDIILAVNRTDTKHLVLMDTILLPADLSGDIEYYLPFPFSVPYISNIDKIIFFSYPAQAFAAYEKGELVYTGPVNMGRKKDPTPTGLYYTNWKAEKTTSTFNDEWDLHWNFNIENKEGIGWHEYDMPGYPSSHSCLRLQEKDARYLYKWGEQWVLDNKEKILFKGTPVVVFGTYDFDGPKPWLQLTANPDILTITTSQLQQLVAPHLNEILDWQKKKRPA